VQNLKIAKLGFVLSVLALVSSLAVYGGISSGYIGSTQASPVVGASVLSTFVPRLTINAVDSNGNDLNGMYVTLSQNGTLIHSNFTPTSFKLNSSLVYTVTVADYGGYTFDHWSNGSTVRTTTITISSNAVLTAIYRKVGSALPQGESILTVATVDSSGKVLSGLYTSLWQNGTLISSTDSPARFLVYTGATYQVIVTSYGNYTFDHWSNGSTDPMITTNTSNTADLNLVAIYN
jgi:hypothetical protein